MILFNQKREKTKCPKGPPSDFGMLQRNQDIFQGTNLGSPETITQKRALFVFGLVTLQGNPEPK